MRALFRRDILSQSEIIFIFITSLKFDDYFVYATEKLLQTLEWRKKSRFYYGHSDDDDTEDDANECGWWREK